ncbi:MAG TPA: phosphotriesterase [Cyclobacteriaceae bacterium]|jgi:phosphotriesterase-related protein
MITRRKLLRNALLGTMSVVGIPALYGLEKVPYQRRKRVIMTVRGPVLAAELGFILSHEHVLVDFVGAKDTGYHRWNRDDVVRVMTPKLAAVKAAGFDALFECTPAWLGRDPGLLVALSEVTGLHLVTNTGYYGARQNRFLPESVQKASAEALADKWIAEWERGIEDTRVKPGFIKIGLDEGPLSDIHQRLVRAAAITHRETGLAIASHTGGGPGAFEALDILADEGVAAEAFIWVHAQGEKDIQRHVAAARRGCWISLDGVQDDNAARYADNILALRDAGLLHKVLISQDAGWYDPDKKGDSTFRSYLSIHNVLIPLLKERGVTDNEVRMILHDNVLDAFGGT